MNERGIGVGVHYPAMHLFTLTASWATGRATSRMPSASARETVTLPLFPAMR